MPPRKRKSAAAEDDASDKPVYLVVEHKVKEPSHSIVIAGTRTPPVTIPLRHAKRGMSFAAVDSRGIVGVGGDSRSPCTVVYNLTTSTESGGPRLRKSKVKPILIPHRGMLYILSSRPKVDIGCADFLPWFERISFSGASCPSAASCELPPPPIFPYCINPLEFLNPPDVRVAAYAVVDSHILLSVSFSFQQQEEEKGTCAFDMDSRVWEMVDANSLPFLGQAIPIGDHLFVARSKDAATAAAAAAAAVYYMTVSPAKDTPTGKTEVSILKTGLDLPEGGILPGRHLCALGMGRFSSFDVPSVDHGARVVQRTYSLVEGGDTSNNLKLVNCQRPDFQLLDRPYSLARPAPLVAAFTMDSE